MAGRTRTLVQLLSDVRDVADLAPAVAGQANRHTDQAITRKLNQSIQSFRLMISEGGHDYYLSLTNPAPLMAAQGYFTLPTDIVWLKGIDVQVVGKWRELYPFQFEQRNRYEIADYPLGVPSYFRLRDPTLCDIIPAPDTAYNYRVWYLPTGTDLTGTFDAQGNCTAGTATFDGIAGWEDWVVYDTAIRCSTRDAGVNDNFELLSQELARIELRIMKHAHHRARPPGQRRLDTRGRRLAVERSNRWKWWST